LESWSSSSSPPSESKRTPHVGIVAELGGLVRQAGGRDNPATVVVEVLDVVKMTTIGS